MKSGMYVTEIVKKLFNNTRKKYDSDQECLKHILENQVFGLSPTSILQGITQSYIFGFDTDQNISRKNFIQHDLTPESQEDKVKQKLQELLNLKVNMKFDAVIGNPPYQESTDTNFAKPVYHYFIDSAKNMKPKYVCMVHPARFLFNAGATPKDWNNKMLNDPHLSVKMYEPESQKLFSGVDIKGGICITLYEENNFNGGLGGSFTPYKEIKSVLKKVGKGGFNELVGIKGDTKINIILDLKYPNEKRIASNYFERFPKIFTEKKQSEDDIAIYGLTKGNKRAIRYLSSTLVSDKKLNSWKILIPESNGSGSFGETLSTPITVGPNTGCTYTFLQIGPFENRDEAENGVNYLKTKFLRALLGTIKTTQHNSSDVWKNIPLQDFTEKSDIDWKKSIPEIDQQLYAKYTLTEEEKGFIENMIKPMG